MDFNVRRSRLIPGAYVKIWGRCPTQTPLIIPYIHTPVKATQTSSPVLAYVHRCLLLLLTYSSSLLLTYSRFHTFSQFFARSFHLQHLHPLFTASLIPFCMVLCPESATGLEYDRL